MMQLRDVRKEVVDDKSIGKYIPILASIVEVEVTRLVSALNSLADNQTSMEKRIKKETTSAGYLATKRYKDSKENVIILIDANLKDLDQQLNNINLEISKIEQIYSSLPGQETEVNRIRRYLALNEEFYLLLKKKEAEFGIAKAGTVPDFQILMPANVPNIPISPQKGTVYTLWIIIGIIAGFVLVLVRYVLQDTVSTVRELEKNTVAPLLGVVPVYTKEKLRVAKMVVDKNPKSSLSEALRAVRTNIEFVSSQEGTGKKRIISVTSTVAGEGKTFVAINLSGILAMSSQKVVLLDLDMRKPKLHLAFDVANDKGMSTVLSDKCTWQEAVLHTPQQDIDVLPAGPPPPNPAELLMRPSFDQLLRDLHEVYDVIVIDSPPVGLVTDGIIIMQKADLPIYVVRSEYSKRVYLKNINKLVKANGFKSLGVIMNGLDKLKTYGYGYGYGYDYYTDDDVPQGFDANWFKTLLGIK
jgi:capsular exopolysaccharide synthesis family protein